MEHGLTPSEKFVTELCEMSFLKLWTHPNPKGKKGKELCDCLVVCGPHIVIISVKEIEYRDTGDATGFERWTKAAIDKSVSQIRGAERWLRNEKKVERHDGRIISLPEVDDRRYHRIAVALGGKGKVPLGWGDFGHGFVHVCEENSVGVLFRFFDTIADFVDFLDASETLVKAGTHLCFAGGGLEDLVALYNSWERSFDLDSPEHGRPGMLILTDDLWDGFVESDEFKQMQREFKHSYFWGRLIDDFADKLLTNRMFDMHRKKITKNELALVTMALEPRMNRANLAEAYMEFIENLNLKSAARVVQGRKCHAYVFAFGSSANREARYAELAARCLVVRGRMPNIHTVVGIATDRPGTSTIGYSEDIVYFSMPEWSEELEGKVCAIQEEFGYFKTLNSIGSNGQVADGETEPSAKYVKPIKKKKNKSRQKMQKASRKKNRKK